MAYLRLWNKLHRDYCAPSVEIGTCVGEVSRGSNQVKWFYALIKPGYGYPHQAAWPYGEVLLADFISSTRLLWGSDFSPSLEWVSFPQTFGLFADMPFLDSADVERIEGSNLLALLAEVTD